MDRRAPSFSCILLLAAAPLAAQELIRRDSALSLGWTVFDTARNRLVVGGDQNSLYEGDGQRWYRRPVRTTGFAGGMLAYHAATQQTVGFGYDDARLPSTVTWDGAVWRRLAPATTPTARTGMAMAYDSQRARLVMFGGWLMQGAPNQLLDETWEWDGSNWLQRSPTTSPSPRYHAAASYDSARGVVVMFGGADPLTNTYSDELWEWDGVDWRHVVLPVRPAPRFGHAMAFDAARGRTVMFGNDLWEYDGIAWTNVPTTVPWPPPRSRFTLHAEPGAGVVLTGGFVTAVGYAQDAWSWNGTSWTARPGLPAVPRGLPSLQAVAMATDPQSGGVLLFGGGTPGFPGSWTNETWRWDGWAWSQVATSGPPARNHAVAWTDGNSVHLFGGQTQASQFLNDTWSWNGTAWNMVVAANAPAPRRESAVAYDAGNGVAVLFSGLQQSTLVGDTWTFDGSNWQQRFPATTPPARYLHAMAHDPVRGRTVMFGGVGLTNTLADTWEWNGNDWTQIQTTTTPPASYQLALAYDARWQRIVMAQVVPTIPQPTLSIWTFDGVDWTPHPLLDQRAVGHPWLAGWPADRGVLLFDTQSLYELSTNPAVAESFGAACGTGPQLVGRTHPRLGDAGFGIDVVGAPAGAPLLLVGATATANQPVGPCTLLVAPGQASLFALADSAGFWSLDMPLPNAAAFAGVELLLQVAALQPLVPAGFVMSRGLRLHLGD